MGGVGVADPPELSRQGTARRLRRRGYCRNPRRRVRPAAMKKALPLLAFVVFLPACAPTKKTAPPPAPDAAMSSRSKVKMETLQRGHAVYLAHCGRCHEYILPKDVSREDWHVVVPGMAWNAGISDKDEKALTAYIMAAKK